MKTHSSRDLNFKTAWTRGSVFAAVGSARRSFQNIQMPSVFLSFLYVKRAPGIKKFPRKLRLSTPILGAGYRRVVSMMWSINCARCSGAILFISLCAERKGGHFISLLVIRAISNECPHLSWPKEISRAASLFPQESSPGFFPSFVGQREQ